MSDSHPFVSKLTARILQRKDQQVRLTARSLLRGFGYERRSEKILAEIKRELHAASLITDLRIDHPDDLDSKVTIGLREGVTPTASVPLPTRPDLRELASQSLPATVLITTESGLGSGFIVHPDGLVVTARHVIAEGDYAVREVTVTLDAGGAGQREVAGVVFRSHRQLDFALLWLKDDGPFPTLPIGDPQQLRPAQHVLAVGFPSGLYNTVSQGIISNPRQPRLNIDYIQSDTAIDPGNSGGPLVADDGAVGINEWIIPQIGAAKFSLPIDYLTDDIAAAIAEGRDACLAAPACPACGSAHYGRTITWFCPTCGVKLAAAS